MRQLELGDNGAVTELLQWGLARAGEPLVVDGYFGEATQQALMDWQARKNLTPDGIAGERSWASLYPYLTGNLDHTVQAGDTYEALAKRYNSSVEAIATANPLARPQQLLPGKTLRIPVEGSVVPTDIRWSFDLLSVVVEALRVRYPFIAVDTIGTSVLGRSLYQLTIGQGKTRVGYNASHHANEWITTPVVLRFLEQFAMAVAFRPTEGVDFRRLYTDYTLDIVPMVNPDGVDLVTGSLDPELIAYQNAQTIAASFPDIRFPEGWKANIEGIDVNLSYPAGWQKAREIKYAQGFDRPAPRDYVGPAPLAAPEAAIMARRTKQADYRLILAYHCQGKLIYWKYDDYLPPGSFTLAKQMEAVSGYVADVTPGLSGNAGYKDWFIQEYNRPGYTIECGKGLNPLPLTQFDEIYRDNFGILLLGMQGVA